MRRSTLPWLARILIVGSIHAPVLLALGGCEPSDRSLEWRIRFATAELASRAEVIEARVVRGRCGDASPDVIYMALFTTDDPMAPAPPPLGPGSYSIEAYGRDAACQVIAGDCVDRELPSDDAVVELVLQERPPVSACAVEERCSRGRCEPPEVRDSGPDDAAIRDAATRDAGHDAGPPDAGGLCVPDAIDGTGRPCTESADCPTGLVCYGRVFGGLGSRRCTRACTAGTECVPGWRCDTPDSSECNPACSDVPICVCGAGFGLGTVETMCDGRDGDCDGRIDEATDGEDVCGSGTCSCSMCDCDAGLVACGGQCVDTSTDRRHCGGCGNRCGAGFECQGGTCVCMATMCGASCVDTTIDEGNCGSCGAACAAGEYCCASSCTATAC